MVQRLGEIHSSLIWIHLLISQVEKLVPRSILVTILFKTAKAASWDTSPQEPSEEVIIRAFAYLEKAYEQKSD